MEAERKKQTKLNSEEVSEFLRCGIYKPRFRLFTGSEFEKLKEISYRTVESQVGKTESAVIFNSLELDPELFLLGLHKPMLDLVESVIGKNICMLGGPRFFLKKAHSGKYVPWHSDTLEQDEIFENLNLIHVTVAITRSTKKNGCVCYVPFSHLKRNYKYSKLQDHSDSLFGDKSWEILPGEVDLSHGVTAMELEPGECSLTLARTVHRSDGNFSDEDRFIVVFKFLPPTEESGTPETRERLKKTWPVRILVRGEDQINFCSLKLI